MFFLLFFYENVWCRGLSLLTCFFNYCRDKLGSHVLMCDRVTQAPVLLFFSLKPANLLLLLLFLTQVSKFFLVFFYLPGSYYRAVTSLCLYLAPCPLFLHAKYYKSDLCQSYDGLLSHAVCYVMFCVLFLRSSQSTWNTIRSTRFRSAFSRRRSRSPNST